MKCTKCHKDRQQGMNYQYYYGTKTESYQYRMGAKMKRTIYHIMGRGTEWICNTCVAWRSLLSIGFFLVFVAIVLLIIYSYSTNSMSNPVVLPVVLMAFGVCVLLLPPGGRTEWGDRIAVSGNRKTLRQKGYNAFLTTGQYKRISRRIGLQD
jgi:hypothetical protein